KGIMAMTVTSDIIPESWMTPTHLQHLALPEDIWNKFDMDSDRSVTINNQESTIPDHNMGFTSDMIFHHNSPRQHHHMGVPPTPPHSPPTEHDLDELVASIPEILESPSATPPSDISDILSDLESTPLTDTPMEVSWSSNSLLWLTPPLPPVPEESLKRDIMWGGGTCCHSMLEVPPRKERQVSECSADAALRDALRHDEISEDEESEDNLPDTPSGTDSDCDGDDHTSETFSCNGSSHRSANGNSRYTNGVYRGAIGKLVTYTPTVNSEHNYCGRVPETDGRIILALLHPPIPTKLH
ncbi:hypothetical protein SK128_004575, partial [Halocaridina rubra]